MTNLTRSNFQAHPFHLVSPSPWPLFTSIALLSLTTTGVLSMHGFSNAGYFFFLALISVIASMAFWFRDVVSEGTAQNLKTILSNNILKIAKAILQDKIKQTLENYVKENSNVIKNKEYLSYYLAGLLEGDGHISLPSLGKTTLNRVLNPRIIFTSHINNLGLFTYIRSELGNIGGFQKTGDNTLRYIIGDRKGILLFINLIHGKLRTPKNIRFNDLIKFMNNKYLLNIPESPLDGSDLNNNSWFTGFSEADGHFGVNIVESKPKSDTRKRSWSESINLKFRLDQRSFDRPTSSSMLPFMEKLASFLSCNLNTYKIKTGSTESEVLSLGISSIIKLEFIIDYFNKYPLLGVKGKDFKHWEKVYYMICSKEHLSEEGRLKIKLIASFMKKNKE